MGEPGIAQVDQRLLAQRAFQVLRCGSKQGLGFLVPMIQLQQLGSQEQSLGATCRYFDNT